MFKVTVTIQSGDNEPVEIPYLREGSAAKAIASVASLLAEEMEDSDMPASIQTRLLSVTVEAL